MKKKEEKTTKNERICRLLKLTKEESKRFSAFDILKFENSITTTKFFETNERVSKIKNTILIIFFIDIVVFFFLIANFFLFEISLVKISKKHI